MTKDYTISGNANVMRMIEMYDMTYSQARRYCMRMDGMMFKEIAEIEGITPEAVMASVQLAKRKINIAETKSID